MKNVYASVPGAGVDVQYEFIKAALANFQGQVVRRERLEHRDREGLRQWLSR